VCKLNEVLFQPVTSLQTWCVRVQRTV